VVIFIFAKYPDLRFWPFSHRVKWSSAKRLGKRFAFHPGTSFGSQPNALVFTPAIHLGRLAVSKVTISISLEILLP
jgi:hypothetical protein